MPIEKGWKEKRIRERYDLTLSRLEEGGITLEGTTFKWKKHNRPFLKLRTYEEVEKVLSLIHDLIGPPF